MKIAISSTGKTLDDKMDMRFGRALGFIIYDTDKKDFEFLDNSLNMNLSQGAGIKSSELVVNKNVEAIITGYCGPKAYNVLDASNIKIYNAKQDTVSKIIEKFNNNELDEQKD